MKLAQVAALALCAIALSAAGKPPAVTFTRIESGTNSGITQRMARTIATAKDWNALWNQHTSTVVPAPATPSVDFTKETVVAVFMGQRNSGGYSVSISEIVPAGKNKLRVSVAEKSPPKDSMTTQALTQPYDIVRVSLPNQQAIFPGFN